MARSEEKYSNARKRPELHTGYGKFVMALIKEKDKKDKETAIVNTDMIC